jgi:hypothetical protein
MRLLLTAAAIAALLAANASYAQTTTGTTIPPDATSPRPTSPGVTSPGLTMPPPDSRGNTVGTGTPSISSPTANTTTGTASGDNPPGSAGQTAPGMQNSGSSTGGAGQ